MLTLKSPREIGLMRRAGLVVWAANQAVAALVRPGVRTAELDQAIAEVFKQHGAEPLFLGVPGKVPFPAVSCISVNEQVVHGIPGKRVLRDGDVVSVDTGCRLAGWCADSAVSFGVGFVAPPARRLLEVTQASLDLALREMTPGKKWSDVAAAMQQLVEAAGFCMIEAFAGHGIGRALHESPSAPNYRNARTLARDFVLEPGLVLAIEPMVAMGRKEVRVLADHWTQVTVDGSWCAHFEHTVAITTDGPLVLTGPPQAGEQVGKA